MKVLYYFLVLQSSRLLPLLVAGWLYKKIDSSYRPFLLLLLLGLVNESVNYILIKTIHTNAISFNIFQLVECLLVIYQFSVWRFIRKNPSHLMIIAVVLTVGWFVQNVAFGKITSFYPVFRIAYAFVIVLITVHHIIYLANETPDIFANAKFIICVGFIIIFMYQILLEGAYLVSKTAAEEDSSIIIRAFGYINAFVNLIYTWAILVMPSKKSYSLEHGKNQNWI